MTKLGKEWFSAAELAEEALPGLPTTQAKMALRIQAEAWTTPIREGTGWRPRAGRGGGLEYHFSNLSMANQAVLALRYPLAAPAAPTAPRDASRRAIATAELWQWFERQPSAKQQVARDRLEVLLALEAMLTHGIRKVVAARQLASMRKITLATIYNWEALVLGVPQADWLPWLAPRQAGGANRSAEVPPAAWEALKADYLRLEAPAFSDCHRRLQILARQHGWALPSAKTLERRLHALPATVLVLAREGRDALQRRYPAQERDRGVFHALEAVNADGHTWDVFVRWPDGSIGRVAITTWQDLYSGKILSWRLDQSESACSYRLSFGDLVETYGIPDHAYLDNTRAAANKTMSGGISTRYRFKVKAEEPLGVFASMNIQVHWVTPYSGQSKPIERAFRDFAGSIAKHPALAGAYVGKDTTSKPENYGSRAIPFEKFEAVIAEGIAEHNARTGRTGGITRGRSFDQVFAESFEASPIRKASPAQRRLWLLAAEAVKVRADSCIHYMGNRFWAEFLPGMIGQSVTIRFDPDDLHQPAAVYRADGAFVGEAACQDAVGFNSVEAGRQHNRDRRTWLRAQRDMLAAERRMSVDQVAALLDAAEKPAAPPADARVVRPVFPMAGNAALKARSEPAEDAEAPGTALMLEAFRQRAAANGRQLFAVPEEDEGGGA